MMQYCLKRLLLALIFGVFLLSSPVSSAAPPEGANWQLVMADEFDAPKLNGKLWETHYVPKIGYGTNLGNKEWQWYNKHGIELKDGLLRLKAEKKSPVLHFAYQSGMVSSNRRFTMQYGYVECRFRVPKGQGLWPAFWLLPVSYEWPPEIDVMEVLGHQPEKVYFTNHYKLPITPANKTGRGALSTHFKGPDFSADFHTFGLLWQKDKLVWYVDGIERARRSEHIPQEPMYLLANLAVGGTWPGYPDESTVFPAYFDLDYIRVYEESSTAAFQESP